MSLMDMKKDIIIDRALKLFLKESVSSVTIKDIANDIEIGEATVYRYFKTKENIIINCALKLENDVFDEYFDLDGFDTGYQKIKEFYYGYLYIFKTHPEYFRFINQFDAFMIDKAYKPDLDKYEDFIDMYKNLYMKAFMEGIKDNTIKEIDDIDLFYYTSSRALLEFCKKEANQKDILKSDSFIEKSKLVNQLIEIILSNIRK